MLRSSRARRPHATRGHRRVVTLDDAKPRPHPHRTWRSTSVPARMTPELGFLLGAYAAEGHTTRSNWTVTITNACDDVLHRVVTAWQSEFGVVARIAREPGRCPGALVSSKTIIEFLDYLGTGSRASNKRIPNAVLRSPRSVVLSFLQGLALDAYVTVSTAPKWAICLDAPELLDDLQVLLANLGVMNGRVAKYNREYNKDFGEVYATGEYAQRLAELVPFMEPEKASRANELHRRRFQSVHATADVVPGVAPRALFELLPFEARNEFRFLCDRRTICSTRRSVERVAAIEGVVLPAWLQAVLTDSLYFSPVASLASLSAESLYGLATQATVTVNGIVSVPT